MSLGLEAAGFDLFMANELSPMAGETFAFNLLGEDLSKLASENKYSQKVFWINSKFEKDDLKNRLRENPFEIIKKKVCDINFDFDFGGKLIVGNIDLLLNFLKKNKELCRSLKERNIDLLSGGPPCQGFSLAGKRLKDDIKNGLPLSFANFAELIQPKVVLLENVKGITSPFKTSDGIKHIAWLEVSKAFAIKGFVPICMLLNSKYFGVPQNRPRFILLAFRKDIFDRLKSKSENSDLTNSILDKSSLFYHKVGKCQNNLEKVIPADLTVYNIENYLGLFDGTLFPKYSTNEKEFLNAYDAIEDISITNRRYKIKEIKNNYAQRLSSLFKPRFPLKFVDIQNHESRNHTFIVKARFRFFQVLNSKNGLRLEASKLLSGRSFDEQTLREIYYDLKYEKLLLRYKSGVKLNTIKDFSHFKEFLNEIKSKKHSQRAIKKTEPAPAQMTIPDDLCHYSENELRTLTVREMARFQSFPDWFVFRSKVTTGGKLRSVEVPQYTQVGNAVPPILAYELGQTIKNVLKSIE